MSLRVGQRVRTIDGREGIIDHVCDGILGDGTYNYFPGACHLEGMPRADWYFAYQLTPLPEPSCSWVDRILLITYPELYICEKAGECREKGVDCPGHQTPHAKKWDCTRPCFDHARCIPYVPEDEARDWFVVSKGDKGIGTATQRLVRKQDARQVLATDALNRRMFRWQDGLR